MLRRLWLTLALLLALGTPSFAQPIAPRRGFPADEPGWDQRLLDLLGPEHLLREAARSLRGMFYDRAARQDDARWAALVERWTPEAARARTVAELHEVVNRMLGELELSHLALVERAVWERELAGEFTRRATVRLGCELIALDGRLFVDNVTHDGPAATAGLREGDEVVTIDGAPAPSCPRLQPSGHDPGLPGAPGFFLDPTGGALALEVRRADGGPLEPVTLEPSSHSMIGATRASARVVEVEGRRVGVIRLWHFMSMEVARILQRALSEGGALAEADALVLDVRGRGGSDAVVSRVLSFFVGRRAIWSRPVVVLTSQGTRSAKEIFAWRWRQAKRGPLLGERTQGACLGCQFKQLSDGSVLCAPVVDVRRLTGGVSLEGVGVEPDVPVAQLPLPFRAGRDAILDAGLRHAAELVPAPAPAPAPF